MAEYFGLLLYKFIPQTEEEEVDEGPLIVGTWIAKGNSYANRWVFQKSGTIEKYYKNELYKIYYWTIREESDPSESGTRELILSNVNNPNIGIEFQIQVLTGEQLILAYDMGIDESQKMFVKY